MDSQLNRLQLPQNPPWPLVSPLHDHALARELDVPSRLKWINAFITNKKVIEGNPSEAKFFKEAIEKINQRQSETRLYLGVIGEFSSGKSTLINALVRQRLLRSDILQGTTAAATLIGYGKEFTVTVRRKKQNVVLRAVKAVTGRLKSIVGALKSGPPPSPASTEELLQLLQRSTADEEFAKDIVQVDVTLASVALQDGLVIVDTPGANANNSRHGEVTAHAIRDICDAAIVAVPADAAGSESLFAYLEENAKDILHRCIFIITKVDLLRRSRDQTLVVDNLRLRLTRQLGVANPRILAAAPQYMVETLPEFGERSSSQNHVSDANRASVEASDGFSLEELHKWRTNFETVEVQLRGLLKEKRLQAIADDIGILLERLLNRLTDHLAARLSEYRLRHEALEKIVIPDIFAFIAPKREDHVRKAKGNIERLVRELPHELESMGLAMLRLLHDKVHSASNSKELKAAMESGVPGIITSGERQIRKYVERLTGKIADAANSELKIFHGVFQNHYRSLATLGGKLNVDSRETKVALSQYSSSSRKMSADLASSVASARSEQQVRTIGGGAAGAALGTFLLPGVGTVVGAALGSFFSSMFGPSVSELKSQCWIPLKDQVAKSLDTANEMIIESVNESVVQALSQLSEAIDEYAPKYVLLVQQMKERDAFEKNQLTQLERDVKLDLANIGVEKRKLNEVQDKIRKL